MFGQQNNQSDQQNTQIPDQSIDNVISGDGNPQPPAASDNQPADQAWQHPGAPVDAPAAPSPMTVSPAEPAAFTLPTPSPAGPTAAPASESSVTDDLITIKQQALNQLTPLVGQLDQSPEDKFRTTMMMIQASDDQSLVKTAYEAAGKIEDEKVRAQALLDIVNEINYFTQHHDAEA